MLLRATVSRVSIGLLLGVVLGAVLQQSNTRVAPDLGAALLDHDLSAATASTSAPNPCHASIDNESCTAQGGTPVGEDGCYLPGPCTCPGGSPGTCGAGSCVNCSAASSAAPAYCCSLLLQLCVAQGPESPECEGGGSYADPTCGGRASGPGEFCGPPPSSTPGTPPPPASGSSTPGTPPPSSASSASVASLASSASSGPGGDSTWCCSPGGLCVVEGSVGCEEGGGSYPDATCGGRADGPGGFCDLPTESSAPGLFCCGYGEQEGQCIAVTAETQDLCDMSFGVLPGNDPACGGGCVPASSSAPVYCCAFDGSGCIGAPDGDPGNDACDQNNTGFADPMCNGACGASSSVPQWCCYHNLPPGPANCGQL